MACKKSRHCIVRPHATYRNYTGPRIAVLTGFPLIRMDKILGIFCFSANFQRLACIVLIDQFNCRIPYFTNLCLCVLLGSFSLVLSFVLGTFCIDLSGWFVLPVPDSRDRRTGSAAPSPERAVVSAPASPSPGSYRTTPPHPSYRLHLRSEQKNKLMFVFVSVEDKQANYRDHLRQYSYLLPPPPP